MLRINCLRHWIRRSDGSIYLVVHIWLRRIRLALFVTCHMILLQHFDRHRRKCLRQGRVEPLTSFQADGEPIGRGVLSAETLRQMREPHATQYGADIWGLGTILYARDAAGNWVIGHDGDNEPAINTAARVNPATGDGIVVLETGTPLLATRIAGEWVFWLYGVPDLLMVTMAAPRITQQILIGWLGIALLLPLLAGVRWWRSRQNA